VIFATNGKASWMKSHTQIPTALVIGNIIRIYFSARDAENRSHTGFFDVSATAPKKILHINKKPVLDLGSPGTFDDDGVMPSSVVAAEGKIFLYYIGWNRGVTVPYRNAIGLAVSVDGGETFKKMGKGPVLGLAPDEPYMAITPYVIKEKNRWRMWYSSGTDWVKAGEKFEPVYVIRYAESEDGINWRRASSICIKPKSKYEAAARPMVIKSGGIYRMWFCYRDSFDYRGGKGSYRIGYAASKDGIKWQRNDAGAGIKLSQKGWDSEMLCYPNIVSVKNKHYMFYNGNGFGKTGIGVAEFEGKL